MQVARQAAFAATILSLSACEPVAVGAPRPCEAIDEMAYHQALDRGAAKAQARIHPDGMVDLKTSGIEHCSTGKGLRKVCERPGEYVLHYVLADGSDAWVRVPEGATYRFNVHARPTTCEMFLPEG